MTGKPLGPIGQLDLLVDFCHHTPTVDLSLRNNGWHITIDTRTAMKTGSLVSEVFPGPLTKALGRALDKIHRRDTRPAAQSKEAPDG